MQHNLTMLSGMIIIPLFVAKTVCLDDDWVSTSQVFSTALFICGVSTLMQAVVGSRSHQLVHLSNGLITRELATKSHATKPHATLLHAAL